MSTDDRISIEERVRIATQARASLVRDLRPLPAAPEPAPPRLRGTHRSHRWVTWGVPLAAAAAVAAVALSLAAVRQQDTAPGKPSPPATGSAGIPRYYVALKEVGSQIAAKALIVGDDRAGAAIATVPAPHGVTFNLVTGTADDRTFLVSALRGSEMQRDPVMIWYLLRLTPGGAHPYRLTKLPGGVAFGLFAALSPDGTELAVESLFDGKVSKVTIVSVTSGKPLRSWATNTRIALSLAGWAISWLSDGRHVAFSVSRSTSVQVRTLDVTAPGADLLAASRVLVTIPVSSPDTCRSVRATPDGGTVVCASQYQFLTQSGPNPSCQEHGPAFTAYSVRTGKPARVLYRYRGPCTSGQASVQWLDASARHVIGVLRLLGDPGWPPAGKLGVITKDGGFQPIKLPKAVILTSISNIAF